MEKILSVKNMVCDRCTMVVNQVLENLKISGRTVRLGEIILDGTIEKIQYNELQVKLQSLGFELIDDKKIQLVEKIKTCIIDLIYRYTPGATISISSYSTYLTDQLHEDYAMLSNLFSEVEGTTIEQYVIHQKIGRVKELLTYGEFNISEIADRLDYSSVSHLSNQFKKVTGISPSRFTSQRDLLRIPLDKI